MAQWFEASLGHRVKLSNRVYSCKLKCIGDAPLLWLPGQFITFDLPIGQKRLDRWRSYSISNIPNSENIIELLIAKQGQGLGSTYLCNDLYIGQHVKFKGPEGKFILPNSDFKTVVMICTGTGIAPFLSILEQQFNSTTSNYSKFHLIYGGRNLEELYFLNQINKLQTKLQIKLSIALSREQETCYKHGYLHQIYLDQDSTEHQNNFFMICGWQAMVDEAIENLQQKLFVPKANILSELYG